MSLELLADLDGNRLRVAMMQHGQPVDLWLDDVDRPLAYGSILSCWISRPMPELGAAFAETDCGAAVFLRGAELPSAGASVTAQVKAEAGRGKLARVSTEISFPGPSLVYLPKGTGVHRSRRLGRISGRDDLDSQIRILEGSAGGWLIRSAARGFTTEEIAGEAGALEALSKCPPSELQRDVIQILADYPAATIRCTDTLLDTFVEAAGKLGLAPPINGDAAVSDRLDEISIPLNRTLLELTSGAAVRLETTQALHAVDIDSGSSKGQKPLLDALGEALRQITLRNLSGTILIDPPDALHKGQIAGGVKNAVANAAVRTHFHGMTKLGLIELSRERRRRSLPEILENVKESHG